MKSIVSFGLVIAAIITALVVLAPLASAQSTMTIRTTPLETQTTPPATTPAPSTPAPTPTPIVRTQAIRCGTAQTKLNTRITETDKITKAHSETYTGLQTKFDAFVTSAAQSEFDTTNLVAAQKVVKEAVTAFTMTTKAYSTSLMATKNLSCGESNDAFTNSVTETRKTLTDARTASEAVRKAFTEKAIPALTEYATWLKEQTETQEETE